MGENKLGVERAGLGVEKAGFKVVYMGSKGVLKGVLVVWEVYSGGGGGSGYTKQYIIQSDF